MAKTDLELRFLEIAQVVKDNLNTKITALNAEKADDVTLPTVETAAYEYQDLGFTASPNYDPMVFFNFQQELGETVGNEVEETGRVIVELVTSDRGYAGSDKVLKLLARYRRALREVVLDKWQKLRNPTVTYLPDGRFSTKEGVNFFTVAVQVEIEHAS